VKNSEIVIIKNKFSYNLVILFQHSSIIIYKTFYIILLLLSYKYSLNKCEITYNNLYFLLCNKIIQIDNLFSSGIKNKYFY